MNIATVEAHALSSPINPTQDRHFHGGTRRLLKRDVVLVIVETPDGARGISTAGASSSTVSEYFEDESQDEFAKVMNEIVAPCIEGESIEAVIDAHTLVRSTKLPDSLATEAISALDVALYDLAGKLSGTPVYELLREEIQDSPEPTTDLPLYASAGMYMEPEGYAAQAKAIDKAEFFGYKYRPGIGPKKDLETIDLLAEALTQTEIMMDAHTWWKLQDRYDDDTVDEIVRYAGTQGVYWVEEPVRPEDREGYKRLARVDTPLAGGESEPNPDSLIELGETEAVTFLQGDVRHHLGFTGCLRAVEFCRNSPISFVPHNFGTWIGLAANAHLVAAAPEANLVEYPLFKNDPAAGVPSDTGMYPFDLAFDIVTDEPTITNGRLQISDDPGLGIKLNDDVIDAYPFQDGAWTEFHYD